MSGPENLYWDTCVFMRYLTRIPDNGLTDIDMYIRDAKKGDRKIFVSTIVFAELRLWALKGAGYESVAKFVADLGRAFYPIDPNPNIMVAAGELRDATPTNPSDATTENQRVIGTADAIHLMTCLYIRDVMGVNDIVFHTFDEGKGKTWEGKCVPLLGFGRWFPEATRTPRVQEVCGLALTKPLYPQLDIFAGVFDAATVATKQSH